MQGHGAGYGQEGQLGGQAVRELIGQRLNNGPSSAIARGNG